LHTYSKHWWQSHAVCQSARTLALLCTNSCCRSTICAHCFTWIVVRVLRVVKNLKHRYFVQMAGMSISRPRIPDGIAENSCDSQKCPKSFLSF
jgi:hypothetical protein